MSKQLMIALLVAVVAPTGCEKKKMTTEQRIERSRKELQPILEKHGTMAKAKLDALRAIGKIVASIPPVTSREPLTAPVPQLTTSFTEDETVWMLVSQEWLASGNWTNTAVLSMRNTRAEIEVLDAAMTKGFDANRGAALFEPQFEMLSGLKWLAVIRVHRYTPSKPSESKEHFIGGNAIGDVLVYDIDKKAKIGALPFEVRSGDDALVDSSADDPQKELDRNFGIAFTTGVRHELIAYIDGKPGPASPGQGDQTARGVQSRQIAKALVEGGFGIVESADITDDGASCSVVINAMLPATRLAAGSADVASVGDGKVKPEAIAVVSRVMGKECTVRYADMAKRK